MTRARNFLELISVLRTKKDFLNAVFESKNRQMSLSNARNLIDDISIEELEANNLIEIFNNEVLLGEHLTRFLEAQLVDNYDEELFDYKNIFLKISKSIELYRTSFEVSGDAHKHTRNIHRYLRRIPNNLLDSLKSMQHHVEFTYRSAATNREKLQELKGYNEMLDEFYETLEFISRNMRVHLEFFEQINDNALDLQRFRVGEYILTIRDTLIKTTQIVIDYIRDTERSIHFHKHLVELKELSDRKEIRSKTNMYELIFNAKREPLLSGLSVVEKRNVQIKFYPDYANEEEFELRYLASLNKPNMIEKKANLNEPIEDDFLEEAIIVTVDYSDILYEYIDAKEQEGSFLTYLQHKEPELDGEELLAAYLDTIITNSQELVFTQEDEMVYGYRCMSAYSISNTAKTLQDSIL
ncbi:MAG: hypothetical protein PHU40_07825 [Sulfurimonas sp.]|nr:hypothetical protein [Sulfurimonas sp.]